jgi:RNA polymerase sigma-70 factor (ECF subfamily)
LASSLWFTAPAALRMFFRPVQDFYTGLFDKSAWRGAWLPDIFFGGYARIRLTWDMPDDPDKTPVTELLQAWSRGDRAALDQLLPLIHTDLRRLARQRLLVMAPGNTMQATALVNEMYLRLVDGGRVSFRDRAHFFALSANLMREIVIDMARTRSRDKRGGAWRRISLECSDIPSANNDETLLAIDQAMNRLAAIDERKARVVEMRFFAGMTNGEIAEAAGISVDTVKRDWSFAKIWLAREMRL